MQQELHFSGNAILGERARQEDRSIFQFPDPARADAILLILADGMGGHAGGAEAAETAVRVFADTFAATDPRLDRLSIALQAANREVGILRQSSGMGDMGCTLIGAHVEGRQIDWVSVGDSLLYLCRENRMVRLNADHSFAPMLSEAVRRGEMSEMAAANHPDRNALRSAVVGETLTLIDRSARPLPLQSGDIVLVASDGLATLTEPEMASAMSRPGAAAAAIVDDLLEAVTKRRRPRQDNTTVMIVAPDAGTGSALGRGNALPVPAAGIRRTGLPRKGRFLLAFAVAFILTVALVLATHWGIQHLRKTRDAPAPQPVPGLSMPPAIAPAPEAPAKGTEAVPPPPEDTPAPPAAASPPPTAPKEDEKSADTPAKPDLGKTGPPEKPASTPPAKEKPKTQPTNKNGKPSSEKPGGTPPPKSKPEDATPAAPTPATPGGDNAGAPAATPPTAAPASPPAAAPDIPAASSNPPMDNTAPLSPAEGGKP